MHDPSALPTDIRAYLEAENAYTDAAMADVADLKARLFTEMRGRIKEDDSSVPAPDGPFAYAVRYSEGAEQPMLVRTARDGGAETVLLDANRLAEGKSYFHLGGFGAQPRPPAPRLCRRREGVGIFRDPHPRHRDRRGSAGPDHRHHRRTGMGGGRTDALLRLGRREPSPGQGFPARRRHRSRGRRARLSRRPIPAISSASARPSPTASSSSTATTTRRRRSRVLDGGAPGRAAAPRRRRRAAEKYRARARRRALLHPDQCRRRRGLQDRHRAGRRPRPARTGATSSRTGLGRLILDVTAYARLPGPARARERAAAHRHPPPRRAARSTPSQFDEEAYSLGIIGGYEFDTTMLRFSYSSMTTPARVYDYDMATRTRVLRKEEEIPSGHDPARLCDAAGVRAGRRRRDGAGVAPLPRATRRSTARRRSSSTATAPTASPSPPRSRQRGCRSSTAASSTPSPTSAAARTRASAGTPTGGARRRSTPSPTSSRRRATSSPRDYAAPDKIVGWGGSAGGLLIGAVANMAPELFAGLIAEVPFVDVLDTMLDDIAAAHPAGVAGVGQPDRERGRFPHHRRLLALRQRRARRPIRRSSRSPG